MERREAARRRRGREAMGEGEYEEDSSHGAEHRAASRGAAFYATGLHSTRCYPSAGCYFTVMTQRRSSLGKMDQTETAPRDAYLGLGGTM